MADNEARHLAEINDNVRRLGGEKWLREQFPNKDWHKHRRTDGQLDLCDGSPSDCAEKERV